MTDKKWDAFICHASEDKAAVAQPLAERLHNHGYKIWYDDLTLKIGDSLSRSINHGLANSQYGIVIISHNFFSKDWPQKELEGLVAREINGKKVILPVWHEISREEILEYCPIIADKLAANTKNGLEKVVMDLLEVIKPVPPISPGNPINHPHPAEVIYLIRILREGTVRERNDAARRLKDFNDAAVIDALLDAVKYDPKVRYESLQSLYLLRSQRARDVFIERLQDPSSRIRHVSILALSEIGEVADIIFLQKIIETRDFAFLNKPRPGKGQRINWGHSENILAAERAIELIRTRTAK